MAYNDKEASRFVTEMSERQISAREFFSVGLLDALQRDFGLERAAIFIYNTEGQFLSWIRKNGMEVAGQITPIRGSCATIRCEKPCMRRQLPTD